MLDMGEQKLADSATAHVAVVRARARAARSAPGVGCEAGFRRVLSQRPARAPFPPSEHPHSARSGGQRKCLEDDDRRMLEGTGAFADG